MNSPLLLFKSSCHTLLQSKWPVLDHGSGAQDLQAGTHLLSTLNTFPFLPDLELFWSISEQQKPLR